MNALKQRQDIDYRVIYHIEETFERRMADIYFSISAQSAAPFLDDILNELWDMMVLAYTASVKGTPAYDQLDLERVKYIERTGEPSLASEFIFQYADERFCDLFNRDVYLFLMDKQLNFFVRPINRFGADRQQSRLVNPTIVEVW